MFEATNPNDFRKELEREIREERNRETQMGCYDSWFSDNKERLIEDYLEENDEDFKAYCEQEFKDRR